MYYFISFSCRFPDNISGLPVDLRKPTTMTIRHTTLCSVSLTIFSFSGFHFSLDIFPCQKPLVCAYDVLTHVSQPVCREILWNLLFLNVRDNTESGEYGRVQNNFVTNTCELKLSLQTIDIYYMSFSNDIVYAHQHHHHRFLDF